MPRHWTIAELRDAVRGVLRDVVNESIQHDGNVSTRRNEILANPHDEIGKKAGKEVHHDMEIRFVEDMTECTGPSNPGSIKSYWCIKVPSHNDVLGKEPRDADDYFWNVDKATEAIGTCELCWPTWDLG